RTDVANDPTQQIADLDQSGLSLPDREYYTKTDERSTELRSKFVATVQAMLTLAGADAQQAAAEAKTVLAVETALASAQLDRVSRRDPKKTFHTLTLNELQAMTPNFSWRKYAAAAQSQSADSGAGRSTEALKFQVLNVTS